MTLDEFLDKLREDRDTAGWTVNNFGEMRDSACRCPIEHVAVASLYGPYVSEIAAKIGLSEEDKGMIVFAADAFASPEIRKARELRQRLLEACGLPEEKVPR